MHSSNKQLSTIEQNHLGHFAYLPKNLGFDVYEMNGVTVINCGLKTSMFNIAYGSPKDATSAIDQITRIRDKGFGCSSGIMLLTRDF